MTQALLIDRQPLGTGGVEFWTLNSPATRNALTDEMVSALRAACERARGDAALRAVVLCGAGGHFCAGGSLGSFASAIGRPHGEGIDPLIAVNREYGRLLQALCDLPQVLIAAVQGTAMGGGVGLVCCADHVLASPDAQFATPEVTLGIVPAQIAPFVVRRLGDARARDWLLSGARWSTAEALAAGLVNAVADGDFEAALLQQLKRAAQIAPGAVAQTKQLLAAIAANQPLDAVLDEAALRFAQALRGPEAVQGLKAFAARQPAPWSQSPEGITP
ncbi:MAG: enoyl-CoA hydratase/isomerase family protein [Burkholderiales bacterium]|nr:enoyl-CoA hydratase/isomerase family protein [Burkholderiales bacterium]MBK8667011.1 enoyl-CoA hydratase/isomerase family protein [Burkholderiales bacterium]